jgi:hypothetical protein
MDYTMNLSSFYNTATVVLAVILVLAGIWWIFQLYVWMRRRHNPPIDLQARAHRK